MYKDKNVWCLKNAVYISFITLSCRLGTCINHKRLHRRYYLRFSLFLCCSSLYGYLYPDTLLSKTYFFNLFIILQLMVIYYRTCIFQKIHTSIKDVHHHVPLRHSYVGVLYYCRYFPFIVIASN